MNFAQVYRVFSEPAVNVRLTTSTLIMRSLQLVLIISETSNWWISSARKLHISQLCKRTDTLVTYYRRPFNFNKITSRCQNAPVQHMQLEPWVYANSTPILCYQYSSHFCPGNVNGPQPFVLLHWESVSALILSSLVRYSPSCQTCPSVEKYWITLSDRLSPRCFSSRGKLQL